MLYRQWKYGYTFRKIYLGEGEWTILEPRDYYRLRHFKWFLFGNKSNFYAVRSIKVGTGKTKMAYLHRDILMPSEGLVVDHKNGDSLDNRRANLRLATRSQNSCNSRRDKSKASSRFRGVIFEKHSGLWLARIKCHGKQIGLGRFTNEIDAANAYDEAAKKYHGDFARLNFPEEN
jgi:hypothetical protein